MKVKEEGQRMQYRIFWVYGPTDFDERQEVWKLICDKGKFIDVPWLCVGDFNDILYNYENEWGKLRPVRKIKGFKQMIENCNLIDLRFQG